MFYSLFITNFTNIRENLISWSLQGYETALGIVFYILIFSAIIGYIYLKQQSVVAAAIGTLIIVTAFSGLITSSTSFDPWVNIVFWLTVLSITGLILIFFIRKRGGI